MRLLAVVPSYLPGFRYGGPIQSVHGVARALVERGHRVRVLTTDCDEGVRLPVDTGGTTTIDGVEVEYCRWRGPQRLRYAPELADRLAARLAGSDLAWINGLFQCCSTRAMGAARRAGVPYVVAPRGMLDRAMLERRGRLRKRLWLDRLDRRGLLGASAWHLTAQSERERLPDLRAPLPPSFVVPNGVEHVGFDGDPAGIDPAVLAALDGPGSSLLFLGRLNWKKGLDRLLPALAALPREVRLIVAGPDDGARTELERTIHRLGLEARAHLVGPVTGATRSALLERASLLVLPSYSENFGNVVLEALAAGTPAVVTPEVGAAEVIERTGAGLVLDGAPESLAAGIGDLLGDAESLERLAERGRSAALDFSWARIAERLEHEFEALLASGRPAVPADRSAA